MSDLRRAVEALEDELQCRSVVVNDDIDDGRIEERADILKRIRALLAAHPPSREEPADDNEFSLMPMRTIGHIVVKFVPAPPAKRWRCRGCGEKIDPDAVRNGMHNVPYNAFYPGGRCGPVVEEATP